MTEPSELGVALGRAGRRVAYHLLQAVVEGLKAIEAVIDEARRIGENDADRNASNVKRIDIE